MHITYTYTHIHIDIYIVFTKSIIQKPSRKGG